MDTDGAEYLYNLSILAVTFSATSTLVTVVRQIKGGSLSVADVHLLTTFMSAGFVACITAVLPGVFNLIDLSEESVWATSSGLAAVLWVAVLTRVVWERSRLAGQKIAPLVKLGFTAYGLAVLLLIVNAAVPELRGVGSYAAAITLSLGTTMWLFVRRIAILGRHTTREDWDLTAN
jgi:hypothetical protein